MVSCMILLIVKPTCGHFHPQVAHQAVQIPYIHMSHVAGPSTVFDPVNAIGGSMQEKPQGYSDRLGTLLLIFVLFLIV